MDLSKYFMYFFISSIHQNKMEICNWDEHEISQVRSFIINVSHITIHVFVTIGHKVSVII